MKKTASQIGDEVLEKVALSGEFIGRARLNAQKALARDILPPRPIPETFAAWSSPVMESVDTIAPRAAQRHREISRLARNAGGASNPLVEDMVFTHPRGSGMIWRDKKF